MMNDLLKKKDRTNDGGSKDAGRVVAAATRPPVACAVQGITQLKKR